MDYLDYLGKRFGIQSITDEVKETNKIDEEFDHIIDTIPAEWR